MICQSVTFLNSCRLSDQHTPEYISDLLALVANIPGQSTRRASSCGKLVVPRTRRRIGDRAFSVAAPRAWNGLYRRSWSCYAIDGLVSSWSENIFCFILSTGTRIGIDSVMRPRSSSSGRNTSTSVILQYLQLHQLGLYALFCLTGNYTQ